LGAKKTARSVRFFDFLARRWGISRGAKAYPPETPSSQRSEIESKKPPSSGTPAARYFHTKTSDKLRRILIPKNIKQAARILIS
jgi:hypothetical protein